MPSRLPLWRQWLREPIVVFALIGGGLFALDAAWSGSAGNDREIVISQPRIEALRADFQAREKRAPTQSELDTMIAHWVTNEALYQQARALGLDQDDLIIRRQLIRKMRFLLEDTHPIAEPSREALQQWLDAHPERYGQGATVTFDHVFVARGAQADSRADELLARLRDADKGTVAAEGDPYPGPARVTAADAIAVQKDFGSGFFEALGGLPQARWAGPITSRSGLHLVRVQATTEFQAASVESAGKGLRNDVRHALREQKNAELLEQLRGQFVIRRAAAAP